MGGFGSTRWTWTGTKDTVESNRTLDINRLNRAGCLRSGYRGGWEWTRDGEWVASIWFRRDGDQLVLSYRVRHDTRYTPHTDSLFLFGENSWVVLATDSPVVHDPPTSP